MERSALIVKQINTLINRQKNAPLVNLIMFTILHQNNVKKRSHKMLSISAQVINPSKPRMVA